MNYKEGDICKDGRKVVWAPQNGPQEAFLRCGDREVLYGGAAGGGKSDGLLGSALLQYQHPGYQALILRETYPDLEQLIERSQRIYPCAGGYWYAGKRTWVFPKGSTIKFGYLKKKGDLQRHIGKGFGFIGYDELTHFREADYEFMTSRNRGVKGVRLMLRGTTNPGGPGHSWVRKRWRIDGAGNPTRFIDPKTGFVRRFIPAKVTDNAYYAGTPYEDTLRALPDHLRKMLLLGRWDVVAGAMFDKWDHNTHVVRSFPIPLDWPIWRGADDGYVKPACVLWFTKSKDGRVFVIDELYRHGMTPEEMARRVLAKDRAIELTDGRTVFKAEKTFDGAMDSAAWADTGMGKPNGEGRAQVMNGLGTRWIPCEKTSGARIAGVSLFHSLLRDRADGLPGIQFFERCKNAIEFIPVLPIDPDDMEDVDTDAEDHAWDALRYGLQFKKISASMTKVSGR